MDTTIIKKKVEEHARRNGTTVKDLLKTNNLVTDSSFYRMVKEESFKVKFTEQLADILDISIDELIGRINSGLAIGNKTSETAYQKINYYKNLSIQKDLIISDKEKLIVLYEDQIKRLKEEYGKK